MLVRRDRALQDAERAAGMNAKLRKKGDHAARVGFRIAAARVRIQAEAMASRYLRRLRRRGWTLESAGESGSIDASNVDVVGLRRSGAAALVEISQATHPVVDRS